MWNTNFAKTKNAKPTKTESAAKKLVQNASPNYATMTSLKKQSEAEL